MSLWVTQSLLLKKLQSVDTNFKNSTSDYKFEIKEEPSHNADAVASINKEEDGCDYKFLSEQKICRLCESAVNIMPIFEIVNGFNIRGAIKIVANIVVQEDDWCPKYICSVCLIELQAALTFKQKCQKTDLKYKRIAGIGNNLSQSNAGRHDFAHLLRQMAQGFSVFKTKRHKQNTKKVTSTPSPSLSRDPSPLPPSPSPPPLTPPPAVKQENDEPSEVTKPEKVQKKKHKNKMEKVHKKKHKTKMKKVKMKVRANQKKLMCIKCDAVFDEEEKFKEHRHQNACKRTQCPQCEKSVLNLRIHTRRMHPSGPVFTCEHCGRAYPIMSELTRHMLVHTDRYDFPCSQCSYRGKRKEYLKLHMRSHGPERYLCTECPATFINQSNFNKHKLVHGNKQYQCVKCKKSFRYAKQLQTHDEAQHQKIRHPCTVCGLIFKYRTKLLKHELKVHNREKRKLNPTSGNTLRLDARDDDTTALSEDVPLETFLHFKKGPGSAFFARNFEQRQN